MLSVGAFVEGELFLSWMHFSKPILAFILFLLYFLFAFSSSFSFYSRDNQRTLPWHGDQS
jgi:uncharacterized SAM-binding protein YcdF (DUF218 family)